MPPAHQRRLDHGLKDTWEEAVMSWSRPTGTHLPVSLRVVASGFIETVVPSDENEQDLIPLQLHSGSDHLLINVSEPPTLSLLK